VFVRIIVIIIIAGPMTCACGEDRLCSPCSPAALEIGFDSPTGSDDEKTARATFKTVSARTRVLRSAGSFRTVVAGTLSSPKSIEIISPTRPPEPIFYELNPPTAFLVNSNECM
jgi:hypothetical protein